MRNLVRFYVDLSPVTLCNIITIDLLQRGLNYLTQLPRNLQSRSVRLDEIRTCL